MLSIFFKNRGRDSVFTQHHFLRAKSGAGFTLIELLLYITIVAVMLTAISTFLAMLLQARIKSQVIAEVEQQGVQAMQIIAQTVRNAEAINSPVPGVDAASLSLDVVNASLDPTVFDLSSGVLRVTEGAESATALTNSHVTVSALSFENISRINIPEMLRFHMTITYVNPEGRNEYDYSRVFYTSASLR